MKTNPYILTYKNLFDRISCLVLSSKILSVAFHNQCSRHIFHAKICPSKWSGTETDNLNILKKFLEYSKYKNTSSKIGLKHLAQSFWSCLSFVNMLIFAMLFYKCHQKGSNTRKHFQSPEGSTIYYDMTIFIFYDILEVSYSQYRVVGWNPQKSAI